MYSLLNFHKLVTSMQPAPRLRTTVQGFPGGAVVKNPPANAGDTDSSPGPGRSHMLQSN